LSRPDAARGFILDGFPRNIEQAKSLNSLLTELGQPLDAVLLMEVRNETLMKRLAGRRICQKCGTVYNIHSLPAGVTTCAKDGAELYQRPDDEEAVIGKRLEVYDRQTKPLIEHYSKIGLLRTVAGEGELDEVFERMEAAALTKPVPASKVKVTQSSGKTSARTARTGAVKSASPAKKKAGVAKTQKSQQPAAVKSKSAKAKAPAKTAKSKAPAKKGAAAKGTTAKKGAVAKGAAAKKGSAATKSSKSAKRGVGKSAARKSVPAKKAPRRGGKARAKK
jgi:adenylate kinase